MRTTLSAGVLTLAAAAMAMFPAVASAAERADEEKWELVRTYETQADCRVDGIVGLVGEAWIDYRCRLHFEKGVWNLEVLREDAGEEEPPPPGEGR
ncbi:hypothetical protein KIPE111705_13150 [Kibdelosporangium persicum]|uniref:DUF4333 domain-containing protein n=1 Tax=Kibdelosporangium persicum TaxID=2698649 RepID=A0ABX2F730_9PSEU|nr:hypothetical protein [Kibdelosporangium persicum]NRN67159.1 hypothetical protein [Kibdelosporangium persicum]